MNKITKEQFIKEHLNGSLVLQFLRQETDLYDKNKEEEFAKYLCAFVKDLLQAERERCAKIAESLKIVKGLEPHSTKTIHIIFNNINDKVDEIAKAIRED